jgi:hypothetical protein
MVRAAGLDAPGLISAMEKGDFYASTGVLLQTMEFRDNVLNIELAAVPGVTYEIEFIGVDNRSKTPAIIQNVKGPRASFNVTEDYLFVRARITSDQTNQNFFDETEFEKAWTQPVVYKKR